MKIDFTGYKINMQSQVIVVPENQTDIDTLNKIPSGDKVYVTVHTVSGKKERSLEQLNTYCAGCGVLAENTEDENWNTKEKVDDQCRIKANLIDLDTVKWIETEVDGKKYRFKHFRTKSISFDNMEHLDACGYFTDGFKIQADKIGMDVDDWIKFVKAKMKKGTV